MKPLCVNNNKNLSLLKNLESSKNIKFFGMNDKKLLVVG